ncbi:MAG TPA: protease inhibitor I42 family protein [Longimicrobium sp.]|jgi:inhibitor of cysteine peptidase
MTLRIALCLLLAACAAPQNEDADTAAPQGVVRVTQENSGKTVTLRTGGRMEVALESNATTGYSWQREGGDTAVLASDSSRYQPSNTQPGLVGAGGTQILAFRGARPGRTRLVLVYRQPWNGGATSGRRWEAEVVVQP